MNNAETRAYPVPQEWLESGLSKRELFAAMAMQGLSAAAWTESAPAEAVANWAVQQADALIAALEGASARQETVPK